MNVLEKILEEIGNLGYCPEGMGCGIEDRGITNRYEACEYGWNEAIEAVVEVIKDMGFVTDTNVGGKWIPVSERLPEVPEGTEDFYCPEFNVTIKGADKATTLRFAPDGTWFDDSGEVYCVIAWKPLPGPYRPTEE